MPQNRKKLVRRYSVAAFLASFNPSLAHLHPVFTKAEIDNHQCLKTLATWGPFHIKEFFGANDLIIDPQTGQRLSPEILDALVQCFCYNSCICGKTGRTLYDAILCPAFLASFNPSLAHLLPVFTKAEIDNHECLKSLATWGPFHIKDFFGANEHIIDPQTGQRLSPEILDALVQRFCYNSCICGECVDPFPLTRMCPALLTRPITPVF
ncbi:hypothetical protein B0H14DRAFT_3488958 [Mycena olivaceomarginata]|nr:hypothetical protein B0H14DRAFT_3488958 [Mycena olivaceomarginata]